jgi:hypothetical protein
MSFLKNIFTDLLRIHSSFFTYFFIFSNILNPWTVKSPILKFGGTKFVEFRWNSPNLLTLSEVRYHSTRRPSKLLSLQDSIYPVCINTQLNLVHRCQTIGPQSTQVGAITLELRIWHQITLNLPIQYSPLSPSCPTRSHYKTTNRSLT